MSQLPDYSKIRYWVQNYGAGDGDDQRGAENFVECEGREALQSFRGELHSVFKGNFDEEILDQLVGVKRRVKYGSYEDWARLMLLWIANYKA